MRARWLTAGFVVASLALPTTSSAQGTAGQGAQPAPAQAGGVRRDPQGLKGISPFWESVKKGDDAYVARDYDGALAAYKDAISKEPQNALGHYRAGEVYLKKGDMNAAEEAWVAALRYVGRDYDLRAKIIFVLADLRERQQNLDDATQRWTEYEQFAQQATQTKTYPATAAERKKRIEAWKKMVADYAAVKKRVEQREKDADEKKRKEAK